MTKETGAGGPAGSDRPPSSGRLSATPTPLSEAYALVVEAAEAALRASGASLAALRVDRELTENAAAAARNPFWVALGEALRSPTSAADIRETTSRLLAEYLAVDRAFYAEVEEDDTSTIGVDVRPDGAPSIAGSYRLADLGRLAGETLGRGRPFVVPDVAALELTDAERALYAHFGIVAQIEVPLVKAGRLVAFVAVHQSAPRDWTADEVAMLEETAERTWAAVERVKAEVALRESEARMAEHLSGMMRLYELNAGLVTSSSLASILRQVLSAAVELSAADRGDIRLLEGDGELAPVAVHQGHAPAFLDALARGAWGMLDRAMRTTGERIFVEDVTSSPLLEAPEERARFLDAGIRALQTTPLVGRAGGHVGMLTTYFSIPHRPSPTACHLLDLLAWTTAQFIERARAEEALRESEAKLSAIFAQAAAGLSEISLAGRFLRVNDELCRMLGWPRASLLAMSHDDIAPLSDRAATHAAFDRLVETGEPTSVDRRYIRSDGSVVFVTDNLTRLDDPEGRPRAVLAVTVDHSDRNRAEQAARASEERLRLALLAARMGTWTLDTATQTHHRDANLNRLLDLPPIDSTHPFTEFLTHIHADDRTLVNDAFIVCAEAKQPLNVEFRIVWRDGTVRWLRDQGDVFNTANGQSSYLAGACVDVTDRREAEEALRAAHAKLEERVVQRTAELAEVNAHLRHEIDAQNDLRRRLAKAQEEERQRVARDLHDSVGQLLAGLSLSVKAMSTAGPLPPLVADRLAEVRGVADALGSEVNGLALRLRPTALDDLGLSTALEQLVAEWSARTGIPVDFQTSGLEARLPVEAETVLYRVVQEALTNTAKHASARAVSVIVGRHGKSVTAVVEDDGCGFDVETAGTGRLGLVGMRERVALAGGELDVESSPGAGTTILARIRLADGDRAP